MSLLRCSAVLATYGLLLLSAACEQEDQPTAAATGTTGAATTTTVAVTTTSKPPATAAERAWVAGVVKLRRRLDRVFFQSNVTLTRAQLREYGTTGRSCAPGLATLGQPSARLEQAAATAKRACRSYARAGATYERIGPLLGTSDVDGIDRLLDVAIEHEGNGSNGLRRAESQARRALL